MTLSQLVLSVGCERVIGILPHDHLVRFRRFRPVLQFLSELPKQISNARNVLRIGVVFHHFLQNSATGSQIDLFFFAATEFAVAFEQFKIAFRDVKLGFDRQFFIVERLAERGHQAIGADYDGHLLSQFQFARFGTCRRIHISNSKSISEVTFDRRITRHQIVRRRVFVGPQHKRTREDSAVDERFDQNDLLLLTKLRRHFYFRHITLVGRIVVGIGDHEKQFFADVKLQHGLVIFAICTGQQTIGNQSTFGSHVGWFPVRAEFVSIRHGDPILAGEIQDSSNQAVIQRRFRIFIKLAAADQIARHVLRDRHNAGAGFAAELQNDLTDESSFFQSPFFGALRGNLRQRSGDDAAHIGRRAVGRGDDHSQFTSTVASGIGVDDFDRQRSFECHAAGVYVGRRFVPRNSWWCFAARRRRNDASFQNANSGIGGHIHIHHAFTRNGMSGECILFVKVTYVNSVASFDSQFAFCRHDGCVHFFGEDAGILLCLRCREFYGVSVIHDDFEQHLIWRCGLVAVVVDNFDNQPVAWFNSLQTLAHGCDRTVTFANKVVGDRSHCGIKICGLQFASQQPTAAGASLSDVVRVTGGDHITTGDFQHIIFGKSHDICFRRNVRIGCVLAGHLYVIYSHRFAQIFIDDEAKFPRLVRNHRARTSGRTKFDRLQIHQTATTNFCRLDREPQSPRFIDNHGAKQIHAKLLPVACIGDCGQDGMIAALQRKLRSAATAMSPVDPHIIDASRSIHFPRRKVFNVRPVSNHFDFVLFILAELFTLFLKLNRIEPKLDYGFCGALWHRIDRIFFRIR